MIELILNLILLFWSTSLFIHRRWYLVFLWSLQRKGQWSGSRDLSKIFKPFLLLVKPLIQFIVLLWFYCFKIAAPDVFLVQNPPSVLTLAAVKWASCLRHSAFIVAGITLDALCWHYPLEVVNLEQYTDGFHPYPFNLY